MLYAADFTHLTDSLLKLLNTDENPNYDNSYDFC